jgi:hypothetical protein
MTTKRNQGSKCHTCRNLCPYFRFECEECARKRRVREYYAAQDDDERTGIPWGVVLIPWGVWILVGVVLILVFAGVK